jgi:hypothetical protein
MAITSNKSSQTEEQMFYYKSYIDASPPNLKGRFTSGGSNVIINDKSMSEAEHKIEQLKKKIEKQISDSIYGKASTTYPSYHDSPAPDNNPFTLGINPIFNRIKENDDEKRRNTAGQENFRKVDPCNSINSENIDFLLGIRNIK